MFFFRDVIGPGILRSIALYFCFEYSSRPSLYGREKRVNGQVADPNDCQREQIIIEEKTQRCNYLYSEPTRNHNFQADKEDLSAVLRSGSSSKNEVATTKRSSAKQYLHIMVETLSGSCCTLLQHVLAANMPGNSTSLDPLVPDSKNFLNWLW